MQYSSQQASESRRSLSVGVTLLLGMEALHEDEQTRLPAGVHLDLRDVELGLDKFSASHVAVVLLGLDEGNFAQRRIIRARLNNVVEGFPQASDVHAAQFALRVQRP